MKLLGVLCSLLASATVVWAQAPLRPEDLLESMERNYPPLLAALEERTIAEGELVQARGRFDLNLSVNADTDQFGYYENERVSVGVEQPLAWQGLTAFGGWRIGNGDFASYDGKLDTRSQGEWRGGWRLPLLRNRSVDDRRAGLQRAQIGQTLAERSIDQQRLLLRQLALRRYWDWVAAGERLRVAENILQVAVERDEALHEAAVLGQIAAIEARENERQILQRRAQIVDAQRGIELAAIDLSLFYRDADGVPKRPERTQLPSTLPPTVDVDDLQLAADLEEALRKRPEIARLLLQKEQAQIDIDIASNERLPVLDIALGFTTESGSGSVQRGPSEAKASIRFDLPFQRRAATGKLMAAEAKLSQLVQRERFARDQVEAEVRDAVSAVRTAHRRSTLAADEVTVALDLADAERERFRLGDSTLFVVNLREQAAVEAALRQIAATNDYLRARVAYDQATAKALSDS